jgi:hypothetical protein
MADVNKKYIELMCESKVMYSMTYPHAVFGGAVRSWIRGREPRDIDIAVDCTKDQLLSLVEGLGVELNRNRFGGLKVQDGPLTYDLWPIAETCALVNANVQPTFENLLRHGSFNVDCIILEVDEIMKLRDFGYFDAIKNGFVEVNYEPNPMPAANALRGLRLCNQLDLNPGKSLISLVHQHINDKNRPILEKKYRDTYHESPEQLWSLVDVLD